MESDTDKVDAAVLGLLYLTPHDGNRAWKGLDWDALHRLFMKGLIENPATKAKSVTLADNGVRMAKAVFESQFATAASSRWETLAGYPNTRFRSAGGTTGFLCTNAIDRKPFFRLHESDGTFADYDLAHDDLEVTIAHDTPAAFYQSLNGNVLDHSPKVLGIGGKK